MIEAITDQFLFFQAYLKFVKKIIYKRLYNFFNIYDLLNLNQFGFRKHYSTDLALALLYDKVLEAMANKNT